MCQTPSYMLLIILVISLKGSKTAPSWFFHFCCVNLGIYLAIRHSVSFALYDECVCVCVCVCVYSYMHTQIYRAALGAQGCRICLPMQETVRSLGREDPPAKEMAAHSGTLAWETPWMEEPGRLQSMVL